MEHCPICGTFKSESYSLCGCGYNFERNEITDSYKIHEYLIKIKNAKDWKEEVKLIKRIYETQLKRYETFPSSRWTIKKTAELLKKSKTSIHDSIKLAYNLNQIGEFEKKTQALNELKKLCFSGPCGELLKKKFKSERDLQKHLEDNWGKIEVFKEWDLKNSQYNMGDAGVIDLLAHHHSDRKWLVIELKKDISSDKTVAQILRYMGWVMENKADKNEEVFGLIISAYPPDKNIRLALLPTPRIEEKIYYLEKDEVKTIDSGIAYKALEIDEMPHREREKLFNDLAKKH
jgi:hypothetical protein